MPRKNLIRSNTHPYHVTARGNNREEFPLPISETWNVFGTALAEVSELYQAKIHAFVLMPNHFHLLISTPAQDLGTVMHYLMMSVSKEVNARAGRSGRIFGARYHWSLITDEHYYDCALKYVYRNPVKASLSACVEDYAFSTLYKIARGQALTSPLRPHFGSEELILHADQKAFLDWMNEPFRSEQDRDIGKGLRKTTFRPLNQGWRRNRLKHNAVVITK